MSKIFQATNYVRHIRTIDLSQAKKRCFAIALPADGGMARRRAFRSLTTSVVARSLRAGSVLPQLHRHGH